MDQTFSCREESARRVVGVTRPARTSTRSVQIASRFDYEMIDRIAGRPRGAEESREGRLFSFSVPGGSGGETAAMPSMISGSSVHIEAYSPVDKRRRAHPRAINGRGAGRRCSSSGSASSRARPERTAVLIPVPSAAETAELGVSVKPRAAPLDEARVAGPEHLRHRRAERRGTPRQVGGRGRGRGRRSSRPASRPHAEAFSGGRVALPGVTSQASSS